MDLQSEAGVLLNNVSSAALTHCATLLFLSFTSFFPLFNSVLVIFSPLLLSSAAVTLDPSLTPTGFTGEIPVMVTGMAISGRKHGSLVSFYYYRFYIFIW